MKNRTWIILFLALLLLCGGAALALRSGQSGKTAQIYSQGKLLATVDLDQDDAFTVTAENGENRIVIENGQIYVESASCPDQVCVAHGPASAGDPVVCLPNRLVISLTSGGGVDAATGG